MNPVTEVKQNLQEGMTYMQNVYEAVTEYLVKYGFQALGGFIILLIGFKIAGWVERLAVKLLMKKNFDITLTKFSASLVKIIILIFVFMMALEKFGVTISPLIAAVSAAVFGASFAIQAPLSNYAAGLSVILTRPFSVGNTITVQGVHGIVEDIKLACTILQTPDGERVIVPNKQIVGEVVVNSKLNKVVTLTVGISYHNEPQKAIDAIVKVLNSFDTVSKSPQPVVGVEGFGDSSVNIGVRYWVPTTSYYQTSFAVNQAVFDAVKKAGVTIPFPQREVRILNQPDLTV